MNETSEMCNQTTSEDIPSATSSRESGDGAGHYGLLGSPMTEEYGLVPVPVRGSQPLASAPGSPTPATSGRNGTVSFASAALQSSLASRLKLRLGTAGGTLFSETWKEKVTPAGWRYWAHTASGLRTGGRGATSWPTPNALPPNRGGLQSNPEKAMERRAQGHQLNLDDAATLASWPTPQTFDASNDGTPRALRYKGNAPSEAGNTRDPEKSGSYRGDLKDYAGLAVPWTTPQAHDTNPRGAGNRENPKAGNACLAWDARLASGQPQNGSPAATTNSGQLNPRFSLWLMGYPIEWASCAELVTPSSRKSRKRS